MKRTWRVGIVFLLLIVMTVSVHATVWKTISDESTLGKNDLAKYKGMQIKVSELDLETESITLMFFNGNGDFQEKITLREGNNFNYKNSHRIKFVELTDDPNDPVLLHVEQKVAIAITSHEAPTEMEIGKSYQLEVSLLNTGIESEKVSLEVIPDLPYISAHSERSSKAEPLIDSSVTITLQPLQRTEKGGATVNLLWEHKEELEILESFRLEEFVIIDDSSGFINELVMPPGLMVGEAYYNKARIAITNDGDVSSKFRIKFKSEGIHFNTDSKFGEDVMAEQLDPHTTKDLLYIPEFTPIAEGEQEITVELYANGRIVDKKIVTVTVGSYGGGTPAEPVEEPEEVYEEEELVVQEEPQEALQEEPEVIEPVVQEQVSEGTGNVVLEQGSDEEDSGSSWVALLAPFLLLAVVGKHYFYDKRKEEDK